MKYLIVCISLVLVGCLPGCGTSQVDENKLVEEQAQTELNNGF